MTMPEFYSEYSPQALTDLLETLVGQLKHVFGPSRGGLRHEIWAVEKALGMHQQYFSQSGQDKFLNDEVLKHRTGGVFLELGGYDGLTGSNSLFFEKELGWTGLLIEPSPANFAKATSVRGCSCLNAAVGSPTPFAEFLEIRAGYTKAAVCSQTSLRTFWKGSGSTPSTTSALQRYRFARSGRYWQTRELSVSIMCLSTLKEARWLSWKSFPSRPSRSKCGP